jgi:3-oxoacyl-[acyl-carrier protein] reductase
MNLQLEGKRAVVTGATAGLGRAIALTLAQEGAAVALVGRRAELLAEVAEQAAQGGATSTLQICMDMMQDDAAQRVSEKVLSAWTSVDILVNCAGGSIPASLDFTDEQWAETMTLNYTRHRQLTMRLLPSMRAQRWGRVINITGKNESAGMNATNVAKSALKAWSKGLADMVGRDQVTVNCIAAGRIDSEQLRRIYPMEKRQAISEAEIPAGRFGEPRELADLAVFLCSPRAAYISGALIPVDGGARRYIY